MPSLGEMSALAGIYEEHRPRLLAMLERRIDPTLAVRLDAEDILSEVYIEARRRWPKYRDRTDVPAYVWLYGIARDCLIEAWRKHNRAGRTAEREIPWPERSSMQLCLGLMEKQTGPASLVEIADERANLSQQMRAILQQLATDERDILWMRHHDELRFKDMAAVLEVSENTATQRYVRALKRLTQLWQETHGAAP